MITQSLTRVVRVAGLIAALLLLAAVPAGAVTVTGFTSGLATTPNPDSISAGPDGNVWFTDTGAVGQITPTGTIREFTAGLQTGDTPTESITEGSDGGLWFAEHTSASGSKPAIGRIDPATGLVHNYVLPRNPFGLVEGPDGNVWFWMYGDGVTVDPVIAYITPAGVITKIDLPLMASPEALAPGADRNMWFLDDGNPYQIGRITLSTNALKEFSAGLDSTAVLSDLTAGPDDNVWYTAEGEIGKITPAGVISYVSAGSHGLQAGAQPDAITLGPDYNLWFDDQYATKNEVGEINPSTDVAKEFALHTNTTPWTIAFGVDGNLWTVQTGVVARIIPATGAITDFPTSPTVGSDGDSLIAAPDGNLYANELGTPKSILQINLDQAPAVTTGAASAITTSGATVAGTVTPLSSATTVAVQYGTTTALGSSVAAGTLAAGTDPAPVTAALTGLPAGTPIYYAVTATNSAGTASGPVQTFTTTAAATTPPGGTVTTPPGPGTTPPGSTTPTPTPTPTATSTSTTGTLGDQSLTLISPSSQLCVASASTLSVSFTSVATGKGTKLRLRTATFTIDRGIKRTRHKTVRRHGKRHTVTITVYLPNVTAHRSPATETLTLNGLTSGTHTLKVTATYTTTVRRHGHRHTKHVTKTLSAKFVVC